MRVIACGSRRWADSWPIREALATLPAATTVVHGAAPGADSLAGAIARKLGLRVEAHPAEWGRWGRSAGPRRNARMVALGADLCLAFRLRGPSPGTDDMMRRCREAGIPVEVHDGPAPCPPGTHRGVRQRDGSLMCRVCGVSGRPGGPRGTCRNREVYS